MGPFLLCNPRREELRETYVSIRGHNTREDAFLHTRAALRLLGWSVRFEDDHPAGVLCLGGMPSQVIRGS